METQPTALLCDTTCSVLFLYLNFIQLIWLMSRRSFIKRNVHRAQRLSHTRTVPQAKQKWSSSPEHFVRRTRLLVYNRALSKRFARSVESKTNDKTSTGGFPALLFSFFIPSFHPSFFVCRVPSNCNYITHPSHRNTSHCIAGNTTITTQQNIYTHQLCQFICPLNENGLAWVHTNVLRRFASFLSVVGAVVFSPFVHSLARPQENHKWWLMCRCPLVWSSCLCHGILYHFGTQTRVCNSWFDSVVFFFLLL